MTDNERTHWTSASGATARLLALADALPPPSPLATEVLLIRHGETDWNRGGRCQGITETSLNATGVSQARALRDLVQRAVIAAAYASPLTRARETASIVLGDARVSFAPELREIDYGRVSGLTPDEWVSVEPGLADRWNARPWDVTFPGGESLEDVWHRATRMWAQIVDAHRGERIMIVGHGHVHRLLVMHAVGADRETFWSVPQPNAAAWHISLAP